jgi:hypothetical protein
MSEPSWPHTLVTQYGDGERWCFPLQGDRQLCADVGVEITQAYDDARALLRSGLVSWKETNLDELGHFMMALFRQKHR